MDSEGDLPRLRDAAYSAGRVAWPTIHYDAASFAEWTVAEGIDARALGTNGSDLFLAAACAAGRADAIAVFESRYALTVHPVLGRMPLPPEMLDDVRQTLRVRLLTGPAPKIGRYKGTGPLGQWVRVIATRIALELKEAAATRTTSDSAVMDALEGSEASPELTAAKLQHRELFRSEIERSFRDLSPRDKTLLRLYFVHGMTIDQMGAMLRVHRATVARWLVALRKRIFEELRAGLAIQIRSGSAVNSLIRLVWDDIELSVDRLLEGDRASSTSGGAQREGDTAGSPATVPSTTSAQHLKPSE